MLHERHDQLKFILQSIFTGTGKLLAISSTILRTSTATILPDF